MNNKVSDFKKRIINITEKVVENFLWNFRLIIFLAVVGLLLCSTIMFVIGINETIGTIIKLIKEFNHIHDIYNDVIVGIITIVDDFLLGIVLLIFSLGTYDLFISKIDPAEQQTDIRPDWLIFNSLDELKSVLAKIVLMIMIINFLKYSVHMEFKTPLNLLQLGGGIALIALSMKLTHKNKEDNRVTKREQFRSKITSNLERF